MTVNKLIQELTNLADDGYGYADVKLGYDYGDRGHTTIFKSPVGVPTVERLKESAYHLALTRVDAQELEDQIRSEGRRSEEGQSEGKILDTVMECYYETGEEYVIVSTSAIPTLKP